MLSLMKNANQVQGVLNMGLENFALSVVEPATFNEAVKYDEWKIAMQSEYYAIMKNQTWKIVDFPHDVKPISCKQVYIIKYKVNGDIDKYKAILVAKDFSQK